MKCSLSDVTKSYNGRVVLDHVSYDFSGNGMYVLYGKSGIGKTTLLNILCGYEKCDSGTIDTDKSQIVYALQNYELLDMMSVDDNLKTCASFYPESFEQPYDYMRYLKVDHLIHQYPSELSKGQKQRIMIVKALCRKADIYLFDEPTSALDKDSAHAVMNLLYEKAKTAIVIVVTHDLSQSMQEKTTVLELKKGKIVEKIHHRGTIYHNHSGNGYQKQINIDSVVKKIIKKQSLRSMFLYLLFSMLIIIMLFINFHQYQWKIYDDLYESEYLYIKDPAQYDRTAKDSNSIINFLDFDTGSNTFPIHAVPSHHEQDRERLKNGGVVINQNTATFFMNYWGIKETELIGKEFYLEYADSLWTHQVAFEIREIIMEKDAHTRAMVYYDMEDLKKRIDNYDDINTIQYELKGNPDDLEAMFKEKYEQNVEVFHPMFSDKYELSKQGSGEDIILWLLIVIIYLFYLIFIYVMNQNNWKLHLTSNIILVNDGISCETLRRTYQRLYNKNMIIVSTLSVCLCIACYFIEMNLIFIVFAAAFIIPYFINAICLNKNSSQLQKPQIGDLLKASQEVK